MRKTILFFLFLSSISANLAAEPDSLFAKASEEYAAGNYESALSKYDQILEMDLESAALYYNMGNAAFRSNKLGYAILYYKKALKIDPGFEEAEKNLAYVSVFKEDKLDSVPEFFLKTWINSLYSLFSLRIWSLLALAMFALLLFGTITYIFAPNLSIKKMGFFSGVLAIILFALSISGAVSRNNEITRPDKGIIVAPSVVVKSTPSDSGTDLFVLHEGTDVQGDEKVGGWTEIKISDGRIGWIPSASFELI